MLQSDTWKSLKTLEFDTYVLDCGSQLGKGGVPHVTDTASICEFSSKSGWPRPGALLLLVKRSQLRWFGNLTRMPAEVFRGSRTGEEVRGQDLLEKLHFLVGLGTSLCPQQVAEVREAWASLL